MNISIVIPCLNEAENILSCIYSLINQGYSKGEFEVLVVDGGSTDNTRSIVEGVSKNHSNVRFILETKKGTAAGRNAGIKFSRYDYIALIDADCKAPHDWLGILVEYFQKSQKSDPDVVAVGGTNIPSDGASDFVKSIGVAMDSFPGSFSSVQGRRFKHALFVDSLANLNALYKKKNIVEIGYYDESLASEAEDADLNYRLKQTGAKFLFVPESYVWHKMRPNPEQWLKNMFRYGRGRARLLKRYPCMWTISFCLPLIFLFSFLFIPFVGVSKFFLMPIAYFPVLILYSLFQCTHKKCSHLLWHVFVIYLIQHFGYASGQVIGLVDPRVR
ncbi:glycosyltransferase [Desulfobacula phenolica]|uniref:Glycosyltransferase, catalytic subunit of cellulose synthase and poly-beta-1,6-N-acetylglucosamine synthase n=1 Tax=Desulfobacula phenolica TaxID=90732 RepID=A0A1H2DRX1_9BACT|nr:glycosyltransferase [Desulfobacula phenolica]SDT85534.1 Glycosyltransferase, catalytic subunit of cellulose synthase and poly-beta-1,6-N-acetylglucosamine synthase [Desulfobacula phenolica]